MDRKDKKTRQSETSRNAQHKAIMSMTKSTSKQIELSTVTHVRNCDNDMTIKELGKQIPCSEIG